MKLKDFIEDLKRFKPSLQEGEVVIECPNGLLVTPKAKMLLSGSVKEFPQTVKGVIITY